MRGFTTYSVEKVEPWIIGPYYHLLLKFSLSIEFISGTEWKISAHLFWWRMSYTRFKLHILSHFHRLWSHQILVSSSKSNQRGNSPLLLWCCLSRFTLIGNHFPAKKRYKCKNIKHIQSYMGFHRIWSLL